MGEMFEISKCGRYERWILNGFYLIALPLALRLNSLRIHLGLLHLNEHMDRDDSEGQARMLAHEVDVKEQDRWLPAANG